MSPDLQRNDGSFTPAPFSTNLLLCVLNTETHLPETQIKVALWLDLGL